jgi:hypothetical protein
VSATDDRGSYALNLLDHDGYRTGEFVEVQLNGDNLDFIWPCGEGHTFPLNTLLDLTEQTQLIKAVSDQAYLCLADVGLPYYFLRVDEQGILIVHEYTDVLSRFTFAEVRQVLADAGRDRQAVVE